MRYFTRINVERVKRFGLAPGNLCARWSPREVGSVFFVHLLLLSTLIAYFPFQQVGTHARDIPEPDEKPGQQQPDAKAHNPWDYLSTFIPTK